MLRLSLKLAIRNLLRNKHFTFINIIGLSVGMAGAALLLLWVVNEFSVDQFHKDKDRIYELYTLADVGGHINASAGSSSMLAPVIRANFPQIEKIFRMNWFSGFLLSAEDKHLQGQGILSDPDFLTVLSFPLVAGDPKTALNGPRSMVLTEDFATKLFGMKEAMGKMVTLDSNTFIVSGIAKNPPRNTDYSFEFIIPFNYRREIHWELYQWTNYNIETYVKLRKGVSQAQGSALLADLIKKNVPGSKDKLFLHPFSRLHLYRGFDKGQPTGLITTVHMYTLIAVFLLLIACINYMNLSTARSEKRAREVGIRKVMGAQQRSLIWQFMTESILVAGISGLVALGIAALSINFFNQLIYASIIIPYSSGAFWCAALLFILITGILAGIYPAFSLSAHRPVTILKGYFKSVHAAINPRKILVILQFSFAIIFIISTIVVYRQLRFGEKKDVGFDMHQLAYIFLNGDIPKNYVAFKNELLKSGAVLSVTRTNSPITTIWSSDDTYEWKTKDVSTRTYLNVIHTDDDFVKTMGVHLIEGRDIRASANVSDSTAVLLNESAVQLMGLKNPVGQILHNSEGNWNIVGIIKNYVVGSPYFPTPPLIVQGPKNWFGTVSFRLNNANTMSHNLSVLNAMVKKYNPAYPINTILVDDDYTSSFFTEKNRGKMALLFASLSIFISCLGLYALANYMAESRTKEIGVRKVLGASVMRITTLLSKEFLKLVLIAFAIASPIAWWIMSDWLNDYSYRISIGWDIFLWTGLLSIGIAIVTVSYQSIAAALASPIKSLRSE